MNNVFEGGGGRSHRGSPGLRATRATLSTDSAQEPQPLNRCTGMYRASLCTEACGASRVTGADRPAVARTDTPTPLTQAQAPPPGRTTQRGRPQTTLPSQL